MKALLIEFDINTGERKGGISPRDKGLFCNGWQNLESVPALEIRLIRDSRDHVIYHNIPGVTILHSEKEINAAIVNLVPDRYKVENEALMLEHLRQKEIKLDDYAGLKNNNILEDLYKRGVAGIVVKKPVMV